MSHAATIIGVPGLQIERINAVRPQQTFADSAGNPAMDTHRGLTDSLDDHSH